MSDAPKLPDAEPCTERLTALISTGYGGTKIDVACQIEKKEHTGGHRHALTNNRDGLHTILSWFTKE